MQPTTVLSDSPSIQFMRQDEGRGRRGVSGFSSFFLMFSLPFFVLFFFLPLSPNRHANAKETDRQRERASTLFASPRLGRETSLPA